MFKTSAVKTQKGGSVKVRALCLALCFAFLLPKGLVGQIADPIVADTAILEELTPAPLEDVNDEDYYHRLNDYSPPPVKPIALREISKDKWDDASKGLDYSKDVPPPAEESTPQQNNSPDFSAWNKYTAGIGQILQVLAIILALAAIGYGIFRTLQAPRNRRIGQAQDGTIITAENVDAYIHETDLERFLREALAEGNYALCIRLYYLQTIKTLSEKGHIKWAREKTNRDYLREMRAHRLGREFREVTRSFERIWYGNAALNAAGYALLEPDFKNFLGQL